MTASIERRAKTQCIATGFRPAPEWRVARMELL